MQYFIADTHLKHQKTKTILIAILATFSFLLFTQHISADTYSLSGTITDVNYESGSITIEPQDGSNYTDIKGFSGRELKSIAQKINDEPNGIYDFKLKGKNQIIKYSYNPTETNKHDPFSPKNLIKWLISAVIMIIVLLGIAA